MFTPSQTVSSLLRVLLDHGEDDEAVCVVRECMKATLPLLPPLSLLLPVCEVMEDPADVGLVIQSLIKVDTVVS